MNSLFDITFKRADFDKYFAIISFEKIALIFAIKRAAIQYFWLPNTEIVVKYSQR